MSKEKGKIELRLINPKKAGMITVGPYWDGATKSYKRLKYANGTERIFKFNGGARSSEVLDLENKDDVLVFDHIKGHEYVSGPNPVIEILDMQKQEDTRLNYEEVALDAKLIVRQLNGKNLSDFARLFGIATENSAESTVKAALFEFATNSPEEIIGQWESPERLLKELLHRGRDKGVFKVTSQNVWSYNQITIGASFEQALMWLKDDKNEDLLPTIRKEVNKI